MKKIKKFLTIILTCGIIISFTLVNNLLNAWAIDGLVSVLNINFDNENIRDERGKGLNRTIIGIPKFVEEKLGKVVHLVNSTNHIDASLQYVNSRQPEELKFKKRKFFINILV